MPDVVRLPLLLRACLEVLREAAEPLPAREVLARVEKRVELTPYERGSGSDNGVPRWQKTLGGYTGDAATVGWMTKRDGWALTEAGETALDSYDDEQLAAEMRRRYAEIRRQRAQAYEQLSGYEQVIARALSVVGPGEWTSYDDLARIAGVSAETIAHFLAHGQAGPQGSHRVAFADGMLPDEGMVHARYRGTPVDKRLRSEGVEFDARGRASQEQRVTAAELEERLAQLPEETGETAESPARRAWLVRGSSVDGRDLVPVWLVKGSVSLAAANLRRITPPVERSALKRVVDDDYQHKSYAAREAKLAEFDAFCNRMRPGDYVFTTTQGKAYLGRVVGAATYVASSDRRSNLRREVEWLNPTRPVAFPHLPDPLPAKLASQSDVVELTEEIDAIEELLRRLDVEIDKPLATPERELAFPEITEDLVEDLHVDQEWLQRQAELLWDRRQLILYGPPGTGKTYIARRLAAHLAEPSAVKLVQFHPSYTYEDFFEGFRPVQRADGQLAFELRPGPFRRLVEAARQHPSDPYILIIDEINRANLAKVFGELYFLLEYRDAAIELLYSGESDFTLPPNVFVIGTMNTADRSIALVDAAMRRRFAFVELHPAEPPVAGILARWLDRMKAERGGELQYNLDAPLLLDALNRRIDERDLAIGPSYFMRPEVYRREDGLERVWETSILPLLAEHHYGDPPEVMDQYRLDALRETLAARIGTLGRESYD